MSTKYKFGDNDKYLSYVLLLRIGFIFLLAMKQGGKGLLDIVRLDILIGWSILTAQIPQPHMSQAAYLR